MAPTLIHLCAQLRQLIYYHLDNNLLKNAVFLAGRLHALDHRNQDSIHLLALCHQRLGQHKAAYDCTKHVATKGSHLGCSYVFAQACLAIGKITDGIHALEKSRSLWEGRSSSRKRQDAPKRYTPDTAVILSLLGELLEARNDTKRAVECYVAALKLNPFMWDSFERICNSGTKIRVQNIFKNSPEVFAALSPLFFQSEEIRTNPPAIQIHRTNGVHTNTPGQETSNTRSRPNTSSSSIQQDSATNSTYNGAVNGGGLETPPSQPMQNQPVNGLSRHHQTQQYDAPNAPARGSRTGQSQASSQNAEPGHDSSRMRSLSRRRLEQSSTEESDAQQLNHPLQHAPLKRNVSGATASTNASTSNDQSQAPPRRSRRLFTQIRPNISKPPSQSSIGFLDPKDALEPKKIRATGTRGRSATQSTVGRVVSGNRKPIENGGNILKESRPQPPVHIDAPTVQAPQEQSQDRSRQYDALQWLLDLFCRLGQGFNSLAMYQNLEAIRHFNLLPAQQRDTPWVLAQIGKAHYEQTNFAEAEKNFARLRKMDPSRLEDMEIYSTVLWHLKNDTELTYLAHELMDADRLSSEAWCTLGNSFSLHREHDQALKCFKRATQLNPRFSYAFTLQGHEHMANEDYEKALQAYRRSLAADNRHYNGWYGLGKVYEKLGKHDVAEKHYRAAADINPTNGVLVCCMGVVLEKVRQPQKALQQYRRALEINPAFGIARFRSAKVLLSLQRFDAALDELKQLRDMAPDESNVHFMLGRVYKQLGNRSEALRHYTIAMNLDPKASQTIKEAMQALNDDYDEELSDESEE